MLIEEIETKDPHDFVIEKLKQSYDKIARLQDSITQNNISITEKNKDLSNFINLVQHTIDILTSKGSLSTKLFLSLLEEHGIMDIIEKSSVKYDKEIWDDMKTIALSVKEKYPSTDGKWSSIRDEIAEKIYKKYSAILGFDEVANIAEKLT